MIVRFDLTPLVNPAGPRFWEDVMKKLILVLAMALALAFGLCADAQASAQPKRASTYDFNKVMYLMSTEVEIYSFDEWTEDIYTERDGRLVFVKMVSYVTDGEHGDGVDDSGGYIAFEPGQFETGDIIESYFLANPETDYCDDFIARWDEVVR